MARAAGQHSGGNMFGKDRAAATGNRGSHRIDSRRGVFGFGWKRPVAFVAPVLLVAGVSVGAVLASTQGAASATSAVAGVGSPFDCTGGSVYNIENVGSAPGVT